MKTASIFVFVMCLCLCKISHACAVQPTSISSISSPLASLSLVASDLDDCSRDYSETGGGHFAISGVNEEIKAPWLAAIGISRGKYTFQVFCSGSIRTRPEIYTWIISNYIIFEKNDNTTLNIMSFHMYFCF